MRRVIKRGFTHDGDVSAKRLTFTLDGMTIRVRKLYCVVTGETANGRKVYTECDRNGDLIEMDKRYTLRRTHGMNEFMRL